jgi:hypothetical protein
MGQTAVTKQAARFLMLTGHRPGLKKNSGGYNNGLYYEWNLPPVEMSGAEWSSADYTYVIPAGRGGIFSVYMYWNVISGITNSPYSYYNLHGNKNFSKVSEGPLSQVTTGSGNWNYITRDTAKALDSLWFLMAPNLAGFDSSTPRCVADAVEFRMVSAEAWESGIHYIRDSFVSYYGQKYICIQAHTSQSNWMPPAVPALWQEDNTSYKITIKPTNLFNISNRGTKGFRCNNWYSRSFCDMQDDGGQSKTLFFEGIACEISNFLVDDNLGLLYGMGHAGLTMIGNSYPNFGDNDYALYTSRLGSKSPNPVYSFGKAYLDYANRDFYVNHTYFAYDNFILFGAGTLKARSY